MVKHNIYQIITLSYVIIQRFRNEIIYFFGYYNNSKQQTKVFVKRIKV